MKTRSKNRNNVDKRKLAIVKRQIKPKINSLRQKKPSKKLELYSQILENEITTLNKMYKTRNNNTALGVNQNLKILKNNKPSTKTEKKKTKIKHIESKKPLKPVTKQKRNSNVSKKFKKTVKKMTGRKQKNQNNLQTTKNLTHASNLDVKIKHKEVPGQNIENNTKNKIIILSDVILKPADQIITNKNEDSADRKADNDCFICDNCDEQFTEKEQIQKHMYKHLLAYRCVHCNKKFRKRLKLKRHVNKTHLDTANAETFTCDLCNKSFFLKDNLVIHIKSHPGVASPKIRFKCFCGKQFLCHFNLTRHEQYHLKNYKYKCPKCNKYLLSRKSFMKHAQCHSNIKNFLCQFCGKDYIRYDSVKRHVEICHSGFRVKCPICNKNLKGHLTEHLRTHDNLKPHKCPECGKTFTQATQLSVHRRRHTGDRPFECRICKQPFKHSNAMLTHFRIHTGERPFLCPLCPNTFTQAPHMKTHMLAIHGKAEAYKCPYCDEFFKLKKQMQVHSKKHLQLKKSIESPDSAMNLSRMRFLVALLISMIATKNRLKCLGFNKRLIDDILIDSLEALDFNPCTDGNMTELKRLKLNTEILLNGTIPQDKLQKFKKAHKTTEDVLELLTDDKTSCTKIFQDCMDD